MAKIAIVGAGSVIFAKAMVSDCLSYPELRDSEIALYDIDTARLEVAKKMAHAVAKAWKASPKITTAREPKEALTGADYAIFMIQVGGYHPGTITDFEIPKKYGLRQTIGDTLGIGGIFRALRTIPVMLEYGRIMEQVCPHVMVLNYVNPMAMVTWGLSVATKIRTVGLCHSVQESYRHICEAVGANPDEVDYTCAGINHMAFYLSLEHRGIDLYPAIKAQVQSGAYAPDWDRVRLDMLLRLGYYVAESSEHSSEYNPWYIKRNRPDLIEKYNIPLDEYPRRCEEQEGWWQQLKADVETGKGYDKLERSNEYGSRIIHAMETGEETLIYGNVLNRGLIDNLPECCCVEVPCLVDKDGLRPQKVGALPPQLAALIRTNVNVQELTVKAALERKKEYIYHAALLDPHTAAELSPEEIWAMVDELIAAHGEKWLGMFE